MLFDFNYYMIFIMVSCRMLGAIFFNPFFGRQGVPPILRMGLSLVLAYYSVKFIPTTYYIADMGFMEFFACGAKEFAVGFALGYISRLFIAVLALAGYVIDMQIGYSMATLYDASSNAQISVTGNLMTIVYSLLFFVTNSHLNLIKIIVTSYNILPVDFSGISTDISVYMMKLFGQMFIFALQLAIPFVVLEIITEVAVGMLMKMVPNINVFVINLHLKMIIGMVIIITIIPALVTFMTKMNSLMFERMEEVFIHIMA